MKYRLLADTGVLVSELCLGSMTFGRSDAPAWQTIAGLDQSEVDAMVHRALDAGVNFIDTADVYADGASETAIGNALGEKRKDIVLATKVRGRAGAGPNDVGLSRLHIVAAVEDSLRRLRTDYIDLYQIHRPDPLTTIEDTLRALDDLVRAGKVRYIGCSNLPAWEIMKALGISREQRLEKFRCTQSYYSLAGRELEREIVPLVKDQRLGLLVWSPLAGGFLSGKFTRDGGDANARRATFDYPPIDREKAYTILDVAGTIARAHGATIPQVALAWILTNPAVTSVIIGAKRMPQLDENLRAVDVELTAEDLAALDRASRLTPEYPGWTNTLPPDRMPGERRF